MRKQIGRFTAVGADGSIVSYDVEIDIDELHRLGRRASKNKSRKAHDGALYVKLVGFTPAPKREAGQ